MIHKLNQHHDFNLFDDDDDDDINNNREDNYVGL
jgi:hypothetical protein